MRFDLEYITNYINKKIAKDENFIQVTFYELRVKEKLSEEQTDCFLRLSKQRLENIGYKVYTQGDTYSINGQDVLIENNIFYVAIKNELDEPQGV